MENQEKEENKDLFYLKSNYHDKNTIDNDFID